MTFAELREQLETLGYPVQYRTFAEGEAPQLPYIIFYVVDNDGAISADNVTYYNLKNVTIELYSDSKDLDLEEKLEGLLSKLKLSFFSYETYIEKEKMFEVIYHITI